MIVHIAVMMAAAMMFEPMAVKAPVYETTIAETECVETEAETIYRIHGITPPPEWQTMLLDELKRAGIEWYMPFAVCQVFQESRWQQFADNGTDKGITQQKGVYWSARASRYGVGGADIFDVAAQFRVFASMMAGYLAAAGNDVGWALSYYFFGNGEYADKYVADVMSHFPHLEEVTK